MQRRLFSYAAFAAILLLGLVALACGSDDEDAATPTASAGTAAASSTAAVSTGPAEVT